MKKTIGSKWTVGQYTPSENFKKITNHSCVCCAETLEVIALCGSADDLDSQKQADLMAAAPEMLKALEEMLNAFGVMRSQGVNVLGFKEAVEARIKAHNAIKKAKGEI